jgi:uncharacterized protein (UPF0332 family)
LEASIYLAKADENLKIANLSFDNRCYNACVNRAYFAMLQAAIAILIKKGFPPKKKRIDHSWVHSTFSSEIIRRRKIFPGKFKSYLPDAQIFRNIADYDDKLISAKKAKQQLNRSEEFIENIKMELRNA